MNRKRNTSTLPSPNIWLWLCCAVVAALLQLYLYAVSDCYGGGDAAFLVAMPVTACTLLLAVYLAVRSRSVTRKTLLIATLVAIPVVLCIAYYISLGVAWEKAGFNCLVF